MNDTACGHVTTTALWSVLECGELRRRSLDDVAEELLALFGALHDLAGGLDLLGVVLVVGRVLVLGVLVPHGLLRLRGGVPEPLRDVELSGKLGSEGKKGGVLRSL
jgi:hypothetical protein